MIARASIDFETGSPLDLTQVGVHRYAEHPDTRIWCFAWRIDDEPVQLWTPGAAAPVALLDHIREGGITVSHNAGFERIIWNGVLTTKYEPAWPKLQISQQRCTMARAMALGLPASLDRLGAVLKLKFVKDTEGAKYMKALMTPSAYWSTPVEDWLHVYHGLLAYCIQDVETERAIDKKLPDLTPYEQKVWELDQTINDRGIPMDRRLLTRASELVEYAISKAGQLLQAATSGALTSVTGLQDMAAWLRCFGLDAENLTKESVNRLIGQAEELGLQEATAVLKLRQSAGKSSVTKYKRMLDCICKDDTIKGTMAYYGARTGRWAGRLIQPQNLPRFDHENPKEVAVLEDVIGLLAGDSSIEVVYECMMERHGDVIPWLSKAIRSSIKARPGYKLIGGDSSNIEGRFNAWMAREEWKVQAFRDYDAGIGPDLYKLAYSKALGVLVENVTKPMRQIGKVMELACGYQGGIGAFVKMGAGYGLYPHNLVAPMKKAVDPEIWLSTQTRFAEATDKFGLSADEWTAVKIIVESWRAAHPKVVAQWAALDKAARKAINNPGEDIRVADGLIPASYQVHGPFLFCKLPSGRRIAYPDPRIETETVTIPATETEPERVETRTGVRVNGVDSKTRAFSKQALYGGLECENAVQGGSRDAMVEFMFRAEAAGYPIRLTVHDELMAEVPEDFGSEEEFKALMTEDIGWAKGLPLAAQTWSDQRFVK